MGAKTLSAKSLVDEQANDNKPKRKKKAADRPVSAALLNRRELAKALGLSSRSIDNLQARKAIPVIKISSRLCRFDLNRVLSALSRYELKEIGHR
jgi:hypothetical protein